MFLPYYSNSCYQSDYECICIVINGKIRSVPLNIFNSVVNVSKRPKPLFLDPYFQNRKIQSCLEAFCLSILYYTYSQVMPTPVSDKGEYQ